MENEMNLNAPAISCACHAPPSQPLPQDEACACLPEGEGCACRKAGSERDGRLKDELARRLNRAEGQIRGIKGMVERGEYCDDVLNQLAAARAALKSISLLVLQGHVQNCVARKVKNDETEIIGELIATINKLM